MPEFWAKQHQFLLVELTDALLNNTFIVRDHNFIQYYKGIELSLFIECPQCYFSLEAEFLKRNFKLYKSLNIDQDSVKFTFSFRKKDGGAELTDNDLTPKIKFAILLTKADLTGYAAKVEKIYEKSVELNHAITFDFLGYSENFEHDTDRFEKYYRENKDKFSFWLSTRNSNDIQKEALQEKLLSLKY